jgi:hypothetical protein
LRHWVALAELRTAANAGKSNPTRMAMIEITTNSSMRVKPARRMADVPVD